MENRERVLVHTESGAAGFGLGVLLSGGGKLPMVLLCLSCLWIAMEN